jgi:cyclic pyranopterin phosphate synthase
MLPKLLKIGKLDVELAITTNGIRVDEMLHQLMAANIKAITISLDTLQQDKFLKNYVGWHHRVRSKHRAIITPQYSSKD